MHAFRANGTGALMVTTYTTLASRHILGFHGADTDPSLLDLSYLPPGGGDLVTLGVTNLKGFPTKLEALTRLWTMFTTRTDTYTSASTPANNYTGISSLSGPGQCPISSGYPGGQPWFPFPAPGVGDFPFVYEIVSATDWNIQYPARGSGNNLDEVVSDSISLSGYWSGIRTDLMAAALTATLSYDDAPITAPNTDVSALNPADYTGDVITFLSGSPGGGALDMTGAAVTSGWLLSNASTGANILSTQRQFARVTGGTYSYFVAQRQSGLGAGSYNSADLGSDVKERITLLSEGVIHSGQTIGLGVDGADIVVPFPEDPFPVASIGTNGVFRNLIFVVINRTPEAYLAGFGLHLGDNF